MKKFSVITVYAVFCMLPPSFNPLACNYLDYVQRKKRIVGERLSEMRAGLKWGGGGGGWDRADFGVRHKLGWRRGTGQETEASR